MTCELGHYETYIFDLDGCLYAGNEPYPGSIALISYLADKNKKIIFLSNNSTETSEEVLAKMSGMGFPVLGMQAMVATDLTGKYLLEKYGKVTVSVCGSESLEASLRGFGHRVVRLDDHSKSEFIVLGRDVQFNYEKLSRSVNQVQRGAKLVITNSDVYHPGAFGERVPETGALLASVLSMLDRPSVISIGKPESYPFQKALELYGTSRDACLMVGDNIYTDIKGGKNAGIDTLWISYHRSRPRASPVPTYKVPTIDGFYRKLRSQI
ncbi:hypothetical protein H70357_08735 [Paenibacillus sp. FSL H7-0357]|uniref:HAD-IIA family hydrolase n=1 Tax=unclassified Paenibacillus TaxID=185978 RepID=UPI0004F8C4A2|nr:HAD-IIA family hydrolase [Paenibacillus sp. FSL H7-0357]AIQ16733.1 hypothetical protein H70357_08735 [Paenibacillus sp. FSL H7-0357]